MAKKTATRYQPPIEDRVYYIDKRDVWVNQHNIICKLTNKNKDSLIKRTVYRFTYVENGVRVRLKSSEHPVFFTQEEAEAWAKSRTGINQARKDRVKKRQDWERQFVDLSKHVGSFSVWYQRKAPNYYRTGTRFLIDYVIPYFVVEKKQNNPNHWAEYFNAFKAHLDSTNQVWSKSKKLSYSSKNNIINALNNFIAYLQEHNLYDPYLRAKCPVFPKKLVKNREEEAVISVEEFNAVKEVARKIISDQKDRKLFLDFYHVLFFTGMRFNELRSMTIEKLAKPDSSDLEKNPVLSGFAKVYGKIYIYISLDCQVDFEVRDHQCKLFDNGQRVIMLNMLGRNKNGLLIKKPLKSKPKIGGDYTRTIPIWDKETAIIINDRFKELNVDGVNKPETLLFPPFQKGKLDKYLREVYKLLEGKYDYKTWHCTRHSRATYLVSDTGNSDLTKMFTGHQSDSFNRYNHIGSMLARAKKDVPTNTGLLDLDDQ